MDDPRVTMTHEASAIRRKASRRPRFCRDHNGATRRFRRAFRPTPARPEDARICYTKTACAAGALAAILRAGRKIMREVVIDVKK